MKKILSILMLLLCLVLRADAQDFEPGQQAQGLLESKNVTVDYATGIFHYKVPLYTLKSGDYELPVSLDYTGKGVKVEDQPGLVGYNWTLNTGGVVTRTVRGGVPDEDFSSGYLWDDMNETPLHEDEANISRHRRDGECDIFTAVLGGQRVNFILRRKGYELYGEPLERADVRIECLHQPGKEIEGWVVTDGTGNRYVYLQKEWTCNVAREGMNSQNGVRIKGYLSSWYLSRIEPANSDPICFYYQGDKDYGCSEGYHIDRFGNTYLTRYTYGRPMEVHTFDFAKYKKEFDEAIDRAMFHIQNQNLRLEMDNSYLILTDEGKWFRNPNFDFAQEQVSQNFRIMGIAGSLKGIEGVSKELMELLSRLEDAYGGNWEISHSFSMARSVLEKALGDVDYITERTVNNGTAYRIYTPVLAQIVCKERVVFDYTGKNDRLAGITIQSYEGERSAGVRLHYSKEDNLASLSVYGKDTSEVKHTGFAYYECPSGAEVTGDVYGYKRKDRGEDDSPFDPTLDEEFAKIGSLREVSLPDGGHVRVDYELNSFDPEKRFPYGGIRLRSLLTDSGTGEKADTLTYRYEEGYTMFFEGESNFKSIHYGPFGDEVACSRMMNKGNAIGCPGNNGMYYTCVRESVAGKGSRVYVFNRVYPCDGHLTYPFWLCGLPLYTATLNEAGHLERAVRKLYYTDLSINGNGSFPSLDMGFFVHHEACAYNQSLPQLMADEEYMEREALEEYYRSQPNLVIGGVCYYSPYSDCYLKNIEPRIRDSYRPVRYTQLFGGATLLKERQEFRFGAGDSIHWSVVPSGMVPFSRKVYHYDRLPDHTYPTRVVEYDSEGDSCVMYISRAGDMEAACHEAVAAMKERRIVAPVVRRTQVKEGRLVEETVSEYQTAEMNGRFCYGVSSVSTYTPEHPVEANAAGGHSLYVYGKERYTLRKSFRLDSVGRTSYLPVEVDEEGTRTSLCYDRFGKQLLLKARHTPASQVVAVAGKRDASVREQADRVRVLRILSDRSCRFMKGFLSMDLDKVPYLEYQALRRTEVFRRGVRLVELLALKERDWSGDPLCIKEADGLLDSLEVDGFLRFEEFLHWHVYLYTQCVAYGVQPPWDFTQEEMSEFCGLLMESVMGSGRLWEYLRSPALLADEVIATDPVEVSVAPEHTRWKLYVLSCGRGRCFTCRIRHKGGSTCRTIKLQESDAMTLQKFEFDTDGCEGADRIYLEQISDIDYLVLVPAGTQFEATAYNRDGTVQARFDESGTAELYEYDSAGRVVRVTDETGNPQQTRRYHAMND